MKKIISLQIISLVLVLLSNSIYSFGQSAAVNDDGSIALLSAMLDIKVTAANKKGLLIPRITTAQRNAISAPAKGLLVYDSTVKSFWFHNGTAWTAISTGGNVPWTISGINMYSNVTGNVGIGLTTPKAKLHVAANKSVVFGPDSLNNTGGGQFVWFAGKGAVRFRDAFAEFDQGPYPYFYDNIGENSLATGDAFAGTNSIAFGFSAAYSSGFAQGGLGVIADGSGAMARGESYVSASGSSAYASGFNVQSNSSFSFAQGTDIIASGFVIGQSISDNQTTVQPNYPVFSAGSGPPNSFTILDNGMVGIKTNTVANAASWGMIQIKNIDAKDHLTFVNHTTNNRWGMTVPATGTADLFLKYNGVSKGKFSLVNGAYTLVSDIRMKKDIVDESPVLLKLMQLRAYQYRYIDNLPGDPLSFGFIAQDVQQLFPSFVSSISTGGEERLGIDYNNIIIVAIKGIQEQEVIIQNDLHKTQMNGVNLDRMSSMLERHHFILQKQKEQLLELEKSLSEAESKL